MRSPLHLRAVTHDDRSAALWRVSEAISGSSAALEDSRLFSNAAAALFVEVPAGEGPPLLRSLEAAGLTFDAPSVEALSTLAATRAASDVLHVAIYITFVHREPDLAIDVPKVPG